MKDVIITGFSNPTSEGVTLHFNKPAKSKTGSLKSTEWRVSWDKIGRALIENYTEATEVKDRDELRNNPNQ